MFAYNADKQAFVKDASAGTFEQLVTAAERCPVSIIHPGTPLNPKEKDVEKWIAARREVQLSRPMKRLLGVPSRRASARRRRG